MKKVFVLVALLFCAPLFAAGDAGADITVNGVTWNTVTTDVTTIGTSVNAFTTTGNCKTVRAQALGTNSGNVTLVVSKNNAAPASTDNGKPITLAAREVYDFPFVPRQNMFIYVATGTEGATLWCLP